MDLTGGAGVGSASDEALTFGTVPDAAGAEAAEEEGFGDGADWPTAATEDFGTAGWFCPFIGSPIPESEVALEGIDGLGVEVSSLFLLTSGSLACLPELVAFPVGGSAFAGGAEGVEAS